MSAFGNMLRESFTKKTKKKKIKINEEGKSSNTRRKRSIRNFSIMLIELGAVLIKKNTEKELGKKKKKKNIVSGPLIIVKKDGPDILENEGYKKWLSTVPGFLEGTTKVNDSETKLYDYQIANMNNTSKFRSCLKSRQIGYSFNIAGEALARSHLRDINNSVIISLNKDEAAEKIIMAQQLYESMPLAFQKRRITDNKHSQVFRSQKGNITRILSTAQRPPRGKGFNTDVYFDEYAFWLFAAKIFTASVPVITRGTGSLTIASTPLGASGKFHEIVTGLKAYAQFSRQNIPWWHCPDLCNDYQKAFKEAPGMSTQERVDKFATEIMRLIFKTFPLDDFQQEYELAFIDENVSYIPVNLVNSCTFQEEDNQEFEVADKKNEFVISKQHKTSIQMKHKELKLFCCSEIEDLVYKIHTGEITPTLLAGYDVGRKKDKSELTVLEEIYINDLMTVQIVRFVKQFDREKFELQKKFLTDLMDNLPIIKMGIDANGIGMNLAEDLETKFTNRIESVSMQTEWKDKAVQSLKIRFEEQLIAIPDDSDLKRQIGSIKKKVSDTGFVRYDAEKDKDHHGDKFWSLALASRMSLIDMTLRTPLGKNISSTPRSIIGMRNVSNKINGEIRSNKALVYVPSNPYSNLPGVSDAPVISGELFPEINLNVESSWEPLSGSLIATLKR